MAAARVSDSSGQVRFAGLPPGRYRVEVFEKKRRPPTNVELVLVDDTLQAKEKAEDMAAFLETYGGDLKRASSQEELPPAVREALVAELGKAQRGREQGRIRFPGFNGIFSRAAPTTVPMGPRRQLVAADGGGTPRLRPAGGISGRAGGEVSSVGKEALLPWAGGAGRLCSSLCPGGSPCPFWGVRPGQDRREDQRYGGEKPT